MGNVEPDVTDAATGGASSRATAIARSSLLIVKCGASAEKNSIAVKFAFISPPGVCAVVASK